MVEDFPITIRPAQEHELELLEETFSPGDKSHFHFERFENQKAGKGIYLIAWHENIPIGHLLLEWDGPKDPTVATSIDIRKRAYLFAVETRFEYRKKGVATKLIQEAERLAKEHSYEWTGLEVGYASNSEALRLYEKLGYKDWERTRFVVNCEYIKEDGQKYTEFEFVTYMDKKL
jgi:GNAT superfamily N-acetyltransferase